MKTKIVLERGETLQEAEEKLEKALKIKKECSHGEQYCDPVLNEFHDQIETEHKKLLEKLAEGVKAELEREVNGKGIL